MGFVRVHTARSSRLTKAPRCVEEVPSTWMIRHGTNIRDTKHSQTEQGLGDVDVPFLFQFCAPKPQENEASSVRIAKGNEGSSSDRVSVRLHFGVMRSKPGQNKLMVRAPPWLPEGNQLLPFRSQQRHAIASPSIQSRPKPSKANRTRRGHTGKTAHEPSP